MQHPVRPDLTTFKTDFNVTFGVCICFDLMFQDPMKSLILRGVKNFVYPTYWFSGLPYLTGWFFSLSSLSICYFTNEHSKLYCFQISAAQYQHSFAYANNINLLAANVNMPQIKCSGSGIYSGRSGALQMVVSEKAATKILIAMVPVDLQSHGEPSKSGEDAKNQIPHLKKSEVYPSYLDNSTESTVEFLDLSKRRQSGTICNNGISCSYDIEVSDMGAQSEKVRTFRLNKKLSEL